MKTEYLVLDPVTAVTTQTPRFLLTRTENRIEVSVLGVYKSSIVVRSDRGLLGGKEGEYTLRVDEPGPVKLDIWARRHKGKLRKMDSVVFIAVDELPK